MRHPKLLVLATLALGLAGAHCSSSDSDAPSGAAGAAASWVAVYRGGPGLRHVRAAPVDLSGQWGREAPAPRELGERAPGTPWTARSVDGALRLL